MLNHEKELSTAEFCSPDYFQKYKEAIKKLDALIEALQAGLDIDPALIEIAAQRVITILTNLAETYTLDAIRAGSVYDKQDLPKIFKKSAGAENPGDPAVIAEMAASRGQVLEN